MKTFKELITEEIKKHKKYPVKGNKIDASSEIDDWSNHANKDSDYHLKKSKHHDIKSSQHIQKAEAHFQRAGTTFNKMLEGKNRSPAHYKTKMDEIMNHVKAAHYHDDMFVAHRKRYEQHIKNVTYFG